MTALDICYCVLILAGAFALVCLGILLLRSSITVKQIGNTVEMAQNTINKAEKIMDDISYKLRLLNQLHVFLILNVLDLVCLEQLLVFLKRNFRKVRLL